MRDALIDGKDDEAVALLAMNTGAVFVWWNKEFWFDVGRGSPHAQIAKAEYVALGTQDGADGFADPWPAVGFAWHMMIAWNSPAIVNVHADDNEWDDRLIFAISPSPIDADDEADVRKEIAAWDEFGRGR